MRKMIVGLVTVVAVLLTWVSPAAAQPMVEVEPANVDAAGETEFTINVSGFSAGLGVFAVPCGFPEGGDPAALSPTACDLANLSPFQIGDDGTGTTTVTYDVPEEGMGVAVGDAAQAEVGAAVITVGAEASTTAADDSADDADAAADSLPQTGPQDVALFALFGLTLVAAGGVVIVQSRTRRFS